METGNELDAEKRMEEAKRFYLKGVEISQAADEKTWKKCQREAAKWYRKAAALGLADAQYHLGLDHEFRRESGARGEAEKWYRKAAEQGHADAQYRLGWMLEMACGMERGAEAAFWYRKAAQKGHREAMCALGGLYESIMQKPACPRGASRGGGRWGWSSDGGQEH